MTAGSYLKQLINPAPRTDDPKKWSKSKKNTVVIIIGYCAFVAPLASSIYMPAVLQVKNDLNTTPSLVSATLSVYVLFLGIMPVFWASLCDYYGRRPIYLISMLIFILGSLFAAIAHNIWVFFVMRAIQAFGASSVLSVGGGSLSDVFYSSERGTAFGLYYLGPLIAPMVGPIIGGVVADKAGWRTTMWLLLATAIVAFLLVLFVLPETYRHHIDEPTTMTEESDNSQTNQSDITHVAGKLSLHSETDEPSSTPTSSPATRCTPSLKSPSIGLSRKASTVGRLSVHSFHSNHSRRSVVTPMESAMEYIVPNIIPPHLVEEEEQRRAEMDSMTEGNSNAVETRDEAVEAENQKTVSTGSIMDCHSTTAGDRHVVFPEEKQEINTNEKYSHSSDEKRFEDGELAEKSIIDGTTTTPTAVATTTSTTAPTATVLVPPKRKSFNPLRPLLCLRSPTNALLVTFNGLSLAAQFCMNNTMPISFHEVYGMSETTIGLVFCAGGFGSIVGSIVGGRYSDYVMRRWLVKHELRRQRELRDREAMFGAGHGSRPSSSNGSTPVKEITEKDVVIDVTMRAPPEIRLRSVWLGVFLLPLGLMLFGWSIQNRLALGSAVVGIFFVGFGMMMVYSSTTTALVDANSQNNMATSAVACNSLARGVTGAIGGFTALPLLGAMGSGWLYTFWALMTLLGSIGLVVLLVKAKTWREQEAVAEKVVDRV